MAKDRNDIEELSMEEIRRITSMAETTKSTMGTDGIVYNEVKLHPKDMPRKPVNMTEVIVEAVLWTGVIIAISVATAMMLIAFKII